MKTKFAIIETGGKQYRASEGDTLSIEKITGEYKEGDKVDFEKVLLIQDGDDTKIGNPYLDKIKVQGTIKEIGKGKKIHIIRFKSKSNYSKKKGHRQPYFKVEINKI